MAGDVLIVFPLKDYLFHLTFALVHDHTLSGAVAEGESRDGIWRGTFSQEAL